MGMGDHQTWHGIPEERANWASLHSMREIGEFSSEFTCTLGSDTSAGGKTSYKAKKELERSVVDQVM